MAAMRAGVFRRCRAVHGRMRMAPASIEQVLGHVRERAAVMPAGSWIQGDSISAAQLQGSHNLGPPASHR